MGENKLPPVNAKIAIRISDDKRAAYAVLSPPQNGGAAMSSDDILAAIKGAGVNFGVKAETIMLLAGKNPPYSKQEIVATATLPTKGENAVITYHFSTEKELRPKELDDGSVDYKDLGIVQNVNQDQVLCIKTAATPGTPGKNVMGVELKPRPGRDVNLPIGKNTKASEDGLQLLAAVSGEADLASNKIHVLDTYTVSGDVSNATGNINFVGSLLIHGNVLTGFSIHADGNITVNGCVEDATVVATGNLVVKEGIHGGGQGSHGSVQAGGYIKSKYIQSANVTAGADIEATYIQHANVQSDTSIIAVGTKGTLTGGRVVARNNITAAIIGGRNSSIPTTLEVGNNPATVEKHRQLTKQIETVNGQMASLQQAITMLEGLEQAGALDADRLEALNQARSTFQMLTDSLASLQNELEPITEEMASLGFGSVNGSKSIFPGVRVVIGSEQMLLEKQYDHTSFVRGESGISAVPFKAP